MTGQTLDLHGATWEEALNVFIECYNRALKQAAGTTPPALDVVHGYGSTGSGGVLRSKLRALLEQHAGLLQCMPGEEVDGNPGHTIVVPQKPLPGRGDMLAEEVWGYCKVPRTQSKIIGEFRRQGEPEVVRAIRTLESQRRLHAVQKGAVKVYRAV